jgi:UDP-N-acetylmuramate dehydrogenase
MLIDQCGLKGETVGGAEVSQRHANFIIAHPGCTSRDVLKLIDVVRSRVAEQMSVELETELEIW